jgi:hypothetical protein
MRVTIRTFPSLLVVLCAVLACPLCAAAEQAAPEPGDGPEGAGGTPFDRGLEPSGAAGAVAAPAGEISAASDDAELSAGGPFEVVPFDDLVVPEAETDEERAGLAADLVRRGRESLEAHRNDDAARQLEASYRLVPAPDALPPLAQALERLGQYAAAAERLARYLEVRRDLDAEPRYSLEREVQGLRRRFARVVVNTSPEGALVTLDGETLGTTPIRPLVLNHGHYLFEARLEGYRDVAQRVAVAGGEPLDVVLRLEPIGPVRSRRALRAALWVLAGLTVASAAAFVATAAVGADRMDGLNLDPSSDDVAAAVALENASYGLAAATGALGVTAIVLAIIDAVGGRDAE